MAQIGPLSSNTAFALVKCAQREPALLCPLPSLNHLPRDTLAATITVSTQRPWSVVGYADLYEVRKDIQI